jgi:hypothetical protein
LVVVLKITRPVAGEEIALRCVVVILGGKNPFVVELTSNCADALGELVPTPTCAWVKASTTKRNKPVKIDFFVLIIYID